MDIGSSTMLVLSENTGASTLSVSVSGSIGGNSVVGIGGIESWVARTTRIPSVEEAPRMKETAEQKRMLESIRIQSEQDYESAMRGELCYQNKADVRAWQRAGVVTPFRSTAPRGLQLGEDMPMHLGGPRRTAQEMAAYLQATNKDMIRLHKQGGSPNKRLTKTLQRPRTQGGDRPRSHRWWSHNAFRGGKEVGKRPQRGGEEVLLLSGRQH